MLNWRKNLIIVKNKECDNVMETNGFIHTISPFGL